MTLYTHPMALCDAPPWAVDYGEDRYGLYADFEVRGITQRLRWIAPGRFLMGSPESEPETQHEVTLTEGYWLGETVCTQALWEAVMGENPRAASRKNRGAPSTQRRT